MDVDADGFEERPADGAGRYPGGGLTRARPLEDVARIGEPELEDPGEIGMTGANPGHGVGLEPADSTCIGSFQFCQSRFSTPASPGIRGSCRRERH